MSPAFWWNNEEIRDRARISLKRPGRLDKCVYLGIGTDDETGMRNELSRCVEVLREADSQGLRWKHREMDEEGHMSVPLRLTYFGLKFIFSDMLLPPEIRKSFDAAAFVVHEADIMAKYGDSAKQSGESYVGIGLNLIIEKDFPGAIAVLKRNAEAYPQYPPNYAWLADANEKNGDVNLALANYREALPSSEQMAFGREDEYRTNITRLAKIAGEER